MYVENEAISFINFYWLKQSLLGETFPSIHGGKQNSWLSLGMPFPLSHVSLNSSSVLFSSVCLHVLQMKTATGFGDSNGLSSSLPPPLGQALHLHTRQLKSE